jgi:hypothetical protein
VNRDEIIRMAREAGMEAVIDSSCVTFDFYDLKKFVVLVAAAERKKIEFDGIHTCSNECQRPACVAVREAVEAEREACAKMCEEISDEEYYLGRQYADMIRARGDK